GTCVEPSSSTSSAERGGVKLTVPRVSVRFADLPGVGGGGRKSAVTDFAASIDSVHGPVPLHAPPQPPNVHPASGLATSVTVVPVSKLAVHVSPQSMPVGVLTTRPWPVVATLSSKVPTWTVTPALEMRPRPSLTV